MIGMKNSLRLVLVPTPQIPPYLTAMSKNGAPFRTNFLSFLSSYRYSFAEFSSTFTKLLTFLLSKSFSKPKLRTFFLDILFILITRGTTVPQSNKFAHSELYVWLGYFSLIGLCRLNTVTGDYYMAIKSIDAIDISQKRVPLDTIYLYLPSFFRYA